MRTRENKNKFLYSTPLLNKDTRSNAISSCFTATETPTQSYSSILLRNLYNLKQIPKKQITNVEILKELTSSSEEYNQIFKALEIFNSAFTRLKTKLDNETIDLSNPIALISHKQLFKKVFNDINNIKDQFHSSKFFHICIEKNAWADKIKRAFQSSINVHKLISNELNTRKNDLHKNIEEAFEQMNNIKINESEINDDIDIVKRKPKITSNTELTKNYNDKSAHNDNIMHTSNFLSQYSNDTYNKKINCNDDVNIKNNRVNYFRIISKLLKCDFIDKEQALKLKKHVIKKTRPLLRHLYDYAHTGDLQKLVLQITDYIDEH